MIQTLAVAKKNERVLNKSREDRKGFLGVTLRE